MRPRLWRCRGSRPRRGTAISTLFQTDISLGASALCWHHITPHSIPPLATMPDRVLIGACDPMLCPIPGFRPRPLRSPRWRGPGGPGDECGRRALGQLVARVSQPTLHGTWRGIAWATPLPAPPSSLPMIAPFSLLSFPRFSSLFRGLQNQPPVRDKRAHEARAHG